MASVQGELYYRTGRDDVDHGPVGEQELEELVKQGSVTRNTEVRRDGTSVWIRLGRFLNIPDSKLPEQQSLPESDWARLMDEFVIDSGSANPSRNTEPTPSAPKVDRWSCRVYGKEVGPMEVPLLRAMAEQGQISPTDRVRREGEAKWLLADSIPGLFDGLEANESKSRANLGISPQRFSKVVPKAKKKQPPKPPTESKSAPTKPATQPAAAATQPAAAAGTPPDPTKPSASPTASASSPPAPSSAPPAQPNSSSSSATPTTSTPSSSFPSAAQSAYRKPAFTPPPRPSRKRSSSRDWSFEMPEIGGMDFKQLALGFLVLVVVVGVWWAVGGLSLIYSLFFE